MPVAGNPETSAAITIAVPRRNPYGEVTIRATRTGISQSSRPSWDSMINSIGSGRPAGGVQTPRDLRGTCRRRARPIA